jgi:hypothetical protein
VKQLFATGTAPAGPTVTARSAGLGADEAAAALDLVGYAPPAVADRPPPVRLALLHTPGAGRVLAHVAPRTGGYFTHALLNVPTTADAQSAIQTWGSPLWQRQDPDSAADLPDLPYLPVADVLDDILLKKWLDAPPHRDLLEFALAALLAVPAGGRVFLAAPADDVAKVIYAVTRAIPPGLLDDFTFSTYEPDPLVCPARLVGREGELPAACFAAPHVGFDPGTGRKTDLPAPVPFATFAADALAAGDGSKLDEVKATWQRLGLTDPKHFDLVFRMARGTGVLAKDEAAGALDLPAVAAWISARPDTLTQLLQWALDDRGFANRSFSRAVQALRQKPDLVGKLAQTVRAAGLAALEAGDLDRTATALEVLLPMVAPAKAAAVWGEIPGQVAEPDELPWPVRWYLLPRFARYRQQAGNGVEAGFGKWLAVPPERLAELLALDLPRTYQLAAAKAALGNAGEPSAALARTLAAHPKLALALLQSADATGRTAELFDVLLAEAPAVPWFEELLVNPANTPPESLNRYFEAALAADKIDADHAIRTHAATLLEHFTGRSGLDRLGKKFLAAPPGDVLHYSGLLDFLSKLRGDPAASGELKTRLNAVLAVRAYLDAPSFAADAITATAAALALHPPVLPPAAKGEIFATIARELLKRDDAEGLQADLEAALRHFGPVLANDPADLYENLLRDLRGRTDFGRNPTLVTAFLAVALGAAKSDKLAGQLDGLDGHASAVATEAAKRGGKRLLAVVTRRAETWPKDARAKWGFLHTAVRPQGLKRLLRDAAVFAAGAAITSAAWWVVAMTRG